MHLNKGVWLNLACSGIYVLMYWLSKTSRNHLRSFTYALHVGCVKVSVYVSRWKHGQSSPWKLFLEAFMISQINTDTGIHITEEVICFCELFYDLRSKYLFILFRYGSSCMQTFDKETLTQQIHFGTIFQAPPPHKITPLSSVTLAIMIKSNKLILHFIIPLEVRYFIYLQNYVWHVCSNLSQEGVLRCLERY